ncbi:MAG: TIGR03067 domain-containing protein [Planctomycetota bacterium]
MKPQSCFTLAMALCLTLPGVTALADDAQAIQGTWQPLRLMESGELAPPELIQSFRLKIDTDSLTMMEVGSDEEDRLVLGYQLDPTQSPKHINLIIEEDGEVETIKGIYKIEAGKLLMVFNEDEAAEAQRPTAFVSEDSIDGSPNNILMEMVRPGAAPQTKPAN